MNEKLIEEVVDKSVSLYAKNLSLLRKSLRQSPLGPIKMVGSWKRFAASTDGVIVMTLLVDELVLRCWQQAEQNANQRIEFSTSSYVDFFSPLTRKRTPCHCSHRIGILRVQRYRRRSRDVKNSTRPIAKWYPFHHK